MPGPFNRPILPTTGANPDEQRARTGLQEIVRTLLNSRAFLQRLFPGQILRVPTGTPVALAWGGMNFRYDNAQTGKGGDTSSRSGPATIRIGITR